MLGKKITVPLPLPKPDIWFVRPFFLSLFRPSLFSSCGCSGSAISNPLICVGLWSASWVPKSIMMRHQNRLELLWEFPSSAWIRTRLSDGRTRTAASFVLGIGITSCLQAAIISLLSSLAPPFFSPLSFPLNTRHNLPFSFSARRTRNAFFVNGAKKGPFGRRRERSWLSHPVSLQPPPFLPCLNSRTDS